MQLNGRNKYGSEDTSFEVNVPIASAECEPTDDWWNQGGGGNKIADMTYIFVYKAGWTPPPLPLLPYRVVI